MYKRNKNVKSGASMRARFQASQKKKTAPETLPRKTDLSATRVEQAAPTPTRTNRPANSPAHKNLEIRQQEKNKVAPEPKAPSPVMASRQRALEARRKRAAEKAKEKESAQARQTEAKSKEPKRRRNESITAFRQRLAKYRRENK
jgi:hypothetical protein